MRNLHNLGAIDDSEDALERLLEWGESTYTCDRLSASELLAMAEESDDPMKLELANRYAAALGR